MSAPITKLEIQNTREIKNLINWFIQQVARGIMELDKGKLAAHSGEEKFLIRGCLFGEMF